MPVTPIQKDTSILRSRAKKMTTISEELISDDKAALLELVNRIVKPYSDFVGIGEMQ